LAERSAFAPGSFDEHQFGARGGTAFVALDLPDEQVHRRRADFGVVLGKAADLRFFRRQPVAGDADFSGDVDAERTKGLDDEAGVGGDHNVGPVPP